MEFSPLIYGIYHDLISNLKYVIFELTPLHPGLHSNYNICGMMINKMGSPLARKRNTPRNSTFVQNDGDNDLTMVTTSPS